MLRVTVNFVGTMKDFSPGKPTRTLRVPDGSLLTDLLRILRIPEGEVGMVLSHGKRVPLDAPLHDGLTLELLPLILGG